MSDQLLLTVPEAAEVLRISRNTAYELVRQGQIRAIHIGRKILIPRHALEAWILNATFTADVGDDAQAAVG